MAKTNRHEHALLLQSYDRSVDGGTLILAGMDEAGRGPLVGNVVTACVVMPRDTVIDWVDDSKKLSEMRREKVFDEIMAQALYVSVGRATPEEIDEINILNASLLAMRRAVEKLSPRPDLVLVDGNRPGSFGIPSEAIVKGDAKSPSIAAASILAKVTRDRFMEKMALEYPDYGFEIHKGYGTKAHYAAIAEHGPSAIHRRTFLKKFYGEK